MALGEVLAEAIGKLVQNNRPPQRALRATACQAFATYFCAWRPRPLLAFPHYSPFYHSPVAIRCRLGSVGASPSQQLLVPFRPTLGLGSPWGRWNDFAGVVGNHEIAW